MYSSIVFINLATTLTSYFGHTRLRMSPIMSACLATLIIDLILNLVNYFITPVDNIALLTTTCFGATFVGMTVKDKLGELSVAMASLLYSVSFILIFPNLEGFGGGLGLCAFLCCNFVIFIKKFGPIKQNTIKNIKQFISSK